MENQKRTIISFQYISKILFAKNCTMDIIKNKIEQLRYGDREKKSIW